MSQRRFYNSLVVMTILLLCSVAPVCAFAAEDNPGAWVSFSVSDAFRSGEQDSRWHYWVDTQARFFDPGSGVTQYLVRPAIGYRITDALKGWVGYARFRSENRAGTVAHENRYWQQLDWAAGQILGGNVSMRARLEQRSVSVGDDVALVMRFMTKYVRPLGADGRTSFVVGIEPFFSLNDTDWAGESRLAQNRTFVGMGWRVADAFTIEAGYMNQYLWIDGGEDRVFHHGVLSFNVRL